VFRGILFLPRPCCWNICCTVCCCGGVIFVFIFAKDRVSDVLPSLVHFLALGQDERGSQARHPAKAPLTTNDTSNNTPRAGITAINWNKVDGRRDDRYSGTLRSSADAVMYMVGFQAARSTTCPIHSLRLSLRFLHLHALPIS
jgi:hypothetical protein